MCSGCAAPISPSSPVSPRHSTGPPPLLALGATRLEEGQVVETLGVLLKYQEDVALMKSGAKTLLAELNVGDGR